MARPPLSEEELEGRRLTALAVREVLEARSERPTAAAIAVYLGWSIYIVARAVSELRAAGRWPESNIPFPYAKADETDIDIKSECAAVQASWSKLIELRRRGQEYVPVRVPRAGVPQKRKDVP
jgi:hypothetical protein